MPIWPILLALPLLLAGIFLLIRGLIGRAVDDHPICRGCGFDLFGLPAGATKCSECGADLTPVRAIRFGTRRRRPGMALLGTALLTPVVLGLGLSIWGAFNDVNWIEHAPFWYVLREFNSNVASDRANGLMELSRRLIAGELSDPQITTVNDAALALQADAKAPWIPQLGDFVESARTMGKLSSEKWQQYFLNAVQYELDARPDVRRGDAIIARIKESYARCGSRTRIYTWVETTLEPSDLADPKKNRLGGRNDNGSMSVNSSGSRGHSIVLDPKLVAAAADGPKTLRMRQKVDFYERETDGKATPIASKTVALQATWNLVPADPDTVKAIDDPTLGPAVEKAIKVTSLLANSGGGGEYINMSVNIEHAPAPLAFKIVLRSQGREWPLSGIYVGKNANSGWGVGGQPKDMDADVVDVIIRPDATVARDTIDMHEYWNGEVVIKDVPVKRNPPRPTSRPTSRRAATSSPASSSPSQPRL